MNTITKRETSVGKRHVTWESFVRLTNAGTGLTEAVRESVVVVVRQYIQNKRIQRIVFITTSVRTGRR